jgi:hypothetical protein
MRLLQRTGGAASNAECWAGSFSEKWIAETHARESAEIEICRMHFGIKA